MAIEELGQDSSCVSRTFLIEPLPIATIQISHKIANERRETVDSRERCEPGLARKRNRSWQVMVEAARRSKLDPVGAKCGTGRRFDACTGTEIRVRGGSPLRIGRVVWGET